MAYLIEHDPYHYCCQTHVHRKSLGSYRQDDGFGNTTCPLGDPDDADKVRLIFADDGLNDDVVDDDNIEWLFSYYS